VPLPSVERGEHDIELQLIFPSNPRFVFHDSCGFESGATEELEAVRNFISQRASKGSLKEQLHAIWFCFPTDDSERLLTSAELEFFEKIDTGRVPVIAIFTKFDSLEAGSYRTLRNQGKTLKDAQKAAPSHAEEQFTLTCLPMICEQKHPPANTVILRQMHRQGSDFSALIQESLSELIKKTVDALTADVLKQLFISVQRNNVELCMKYALDSGTITKLAQDGSAGPPEDQLLSDLFRWFPHVWKANEDLKDGDSLRDLMKRLLEMIKKWQRDDFDKFRKECRTELSRTLASLVGDSDGLQPLPEPLRILNLGATIVIVAGGTFWRRSEKVTPKDFRDSLYDYQSSGTADLVRKAIWDSFNGNTGSYDTSSGREKLLRIVLDHQMGPDRIR